MVQRDPSHNPLIFEYEPNKLKLKSFNIKSELKKLNRESRFQVISGNRKLSAGVSTKNIFRIWGGRSCQESLGF